MMSDEQRFLFDLQGYLLVPDVLDAPTIARMLGEMDAHSVDPPEGNSDNYRFGDFLRWSDDYRGLIDHPTLLPIVAELLGPRFRLDHAYGMATRPGIPAAPPTEGYTLHHQAGMFDYGCYYVTHGNRLHNGLIVVSWALSDIEPNAGGFCCIPGSHKSTFPMPPPLYQIDGNPLVKQIPQRAGDVVIFTEALTHGTWPWNDPNGQRRSVLLKYSPHYMQWAPQAMDSAFDGLSERQKLILQGAGVWQRPLVALES